MSSIAGSPPPLDPKRYYSPSGRYALFVNPSSPTGSGSAFYRLTHNGKTVWEKTHPFTLRVVGVTDTGIVAGYGYWQGLFGAGTAVRNFDTVILDPRGQLRLHRKRLRQESPSRYRLPCGVIIDGANDRLLLRIEVTNKNHREEHWEQYALSTGKSGSTIMSRQLLEQGSLDHFLLDARAVPGTNFILVHWWRFGNRGNGAYFSMIPLNGKPLWKLELPADYEAANPKILGEIRSSGAILETAQPGRFTLRFVRENQCVTFEASKEGKVREIGRRPYRSPVEPPIAAKKIRLTVRGRIALKVPSKEAPPAVQKIRALAAAGPGQLAFLRDTTPPALIVVAESGYVVKTISLAGALQPGEQPEFLLGSNSGRFLIFLGGTNKEGNAVTRAVVAEAATGKLTPLVPFRAGLVDSVATFSDGGFTVLEKGGATRLTCWDIQGKKLWERTNTKGLSSPGDLLGPVGITALKDSTLAVLDGAALSVVFFSQQGELLKSVSLEESWGRRPNYPTDILATPAGGFVVCDSGGGGMASTLYEMSATGALRKSSTIRYSSGAVLEYFKSCVTANGQLWVADNHSILRIGPDGKATGRIGEPPRTDRLAELGQVKVFPDGRILAEDARSKSIHVFAPNGRWLRACSLEKRIEQDTLFQPELECGPRGAFYYEGNWFNAAGKRKPLPANFRPANRRFQSVKRHADGAWVINSLPDIAVTPAGDAALLACGRVSLFNRQNTPLRTIVLPSQAGSYPDIAYDGKLVIVCGKGKIFCWGTEGKLRWYADFPNPKGEGYAWQPFLTENSRTLLLFDGEAFTRLALPAI